MGLLLVWDKLIGYSGFLFTSLLGCLLNFYAHWVMLTGLCRYISHMTNHCLVLKILCLPLALVGYRQYCC